MTNDTVIEVAWTTKAGLPAVIRRVPGSEVDFRAVMDSVRNGWRCGYVGVPAGNLYYGKDNLGDVGDLEVHGGVTFSAEDLRGVQGVDWWLGFDCAHYGDTIAVCTLEYCMKQCEHLAEQIVQKGA